MGENSEIAWTDHTMNTHWGCSKVSEACRFCYAQSWAIRTGHTDLWDTGKYRFFGKRHWDQPFKWNRKAGEAGVRRRVFCNSMSDIFDKDSQLDEVRERLWHLISATPNLDWLLLTKRIGNADKMMPDHVRDKVWLGATVVTQAEYDRDYPKLMNTSAKIHFLSMEPLLEPVEMRFAAPRGISTVPACDWVIVGGESGSKARPMDPAWALDIEVQCKRAGVAFFMKQMAQSYGPAFKMFEAFPDYLRVREFPKAA